jgi:CBS domain containing-hemolysin-like protein
MLFGDFAPFLAFFRSLFSPCFSLLSAICNFAAAKAGIRLGYFAARLKSCPVTKPQT